MFIVQLVRCSSSSKKLFQASPASSPIVKDFNLPPSAESDQLNDAYKNKREDSARNKRAAQKELEDTFTPFRYVYPEFLPDPNLKFRNRIREKLERLDMLHRRSHIDIPEFYVGKISGFIFIHSLFIHPNHVIIGQNNK